MIQIKQANAYVDIEIDGTRWTDDFVQQKQLQIYAFKIALTAGFAAPTLNMILVGSDEAYFKKFSELNTFRVYVGTGPEDLDFFEVEVVGHDLKAGEQPGEHILHVGGVLTREKFNSLFLKDNTDGCYRGTALEVIQKAWGEEVGTSVIYNRALPTQDIPRLYKKNQRTLQEYLCDVFVHTDIRPSFPLATIDKKCNLVIKDFQQTLKEGPIHTFVPASTKNEQGTIEYVGTLDCVSYKTYVNRFCGQKQLTGFNTDTGKTVTEIRSIINKADTKNLNKLAVTLENEANPIEHRVVDCQGVSVSNDTPVSYWMTAMHNKDNMINMSSIQTKVVLKGPYYGELNVLDLVTLKTRIPEDKLSGLYLIEALEMGFIYDQPFTTVVWMCRDNYNDIENSKTKSSKFLSLKALQVSSKDKAQIVDACRKSRRALIHARNILDDTYVNEWQRHLIGMRRASVSNFWFMGTSVNLYDNMSRINSLRNVGNNLANKLVNKFLKPPFSHAFFNFISGNGAMTGLFFSMLAGVLGHALYAEMWGLTSDLIYFENFLATYNNTIEAEVRRTTTSESGLTQPEAMITSATYSFVERTDGTVEIKDDIASTIGGTDVITTEQKAQIVSNITAEIKQNIPDAVDLPIPTIQLSDSDAIKPTEDVKDIIINGVVNDLIEKGYVYDSTIVDTAALTGTVVYVTKPDGTQITGTEARRTMLSSERLDNILHGVVPFDATSATRLSDTVGSEMKFRHWGVFNTEDDLVSFRISSGFMDKYRTINATKRLTARAGQRIYVALPASEEGVKFYINSQRVTMNEMEFADIGYYTKNNKPIPYIIYFTTEGYNANSVILEMRKG